MPSVILPLTQPESKSDSISDINQSLSESQPVSLTLSPDPLYDIIFQIQLYISDIRYVYRYYNLILDFRYQILDFGYSYRQCLTYQIQILILRISVQDLGFRFRIQDLAGGTAGRELGEPLANKFSTAYYRSCIRTLQVNLVREK